MNQTYVMLLWHMHQPFYKDLVDETYAMPWVRLHALKDYYGMVAVLRDFPSVHVTFNLVPSLLVQLEEYAKGQARETAFEVAFKPVAEFTPVDCENLLSTAFQVNRENLLNRYPRFRELYEKAQTMEVASAARFFTSQELLDLQVVSQLAWFDEIYLANDETVIRLVTKERGYSENDKSLLHNKEIELFNQTLEEYRQGVQRGQIEVSTSPFYHPILPLLCDSIVAKESRPDVRLPRSRYIHSEDARDQLREAKTLHERLFGKKPLGLWPSEGSVSDEVLQLAAEEGFEWAATDEAVLGRTLRLGFDRQANGTVAGGEELYRPHRFVTGKRPITLFFRDHQISDLIGFVYSRMSAESAAEDLYQRVRAVARSRRNGPAVISIILDGENAWEFFPNNGRPFLKNFYARIAHDPEIRAVTASEALRLVEPGTLSHVVPGSWINANFDVWIGSEEDNLAWDLLADARDFFTENALKATATSEQVKMGQQEVWIAEGSDWCWWYGPEHSTANDEQFDLLYRKHLSNIYRLLGGSPPDKLVIPIKRPRVLAVQVLPTGYIEPIIDGEVTNYFEWLGAGFYAPDYRSSSMHGGGRFVEAMYYGYSKRSVCLRLDFYESLLKGHPNFEIRFKAGGEGGVRLHAAIFKGKLAQVQFSGSGEPISVVGFQGNGWQVAFQRVLELRFDRALLGLETSHRVQIQASLWINELPVQVLPQDGWLNLELAEELVSW